MVTFPYQNIHGAERSPRARVSIFPHGVKTEQIGRVYNKPQATRARGRIVGLSAKAASRLRAYCIENEVLNHTAHAHTWTARKESSPAEWNAIMRRMGRRCMRLGIPVIWRVQLHAKRPTPHIHSICFVTDNAQNRQIEAAWLESTKETEDKHSRRYAVRYKPMDNAGWIQYLSRRVGNPAKDQNTWAGKQWSVWCRQKFTRREPHVRDVFQNEMDQLRRVIERAIVPKSATKIRRRRLPRNRNWQRCLDGNIAVRALDAIQCSHVGNLDIRAVRAPALPRHWGNN